MYFCTYVKKEKRKKVSKTNKNKKGNILWQKM